MRKIYTMRRRKYSYYKNRDGKVACWRCGKRLKVGDLVVSRSSGKGRSGKLYCVKCALELNIIDFDDLMVVPIYDNFEDGYAVVRK